MPYKFNIFTGNLDYYVSGGTGSGNVTGIPPTTPTAIARWVDTGGTVIQNSKTLVQDGGGIEAQGFITNKKITDVITIHADQSMISDDFFIELGGSLVVEGNGELVIV